MSIIWEVVGTLLSGLPFEKLVSPLQVKKTVEAPLPTSHSNDSFDDEHFRKLLEHDPRFSDPVYKQNLQRFIERNRKLEDAGK